MYVTHLPDKFGNMLNCEGWVRCTCGCKYYEFDRCTRCGKTAQENLKLPWNDRNDIKAQEAWDKHCEAEANSLRANEIRAGIERVLV